MGLKGMTLVVSDDIWTLTRWTNWLGEAGFSAIPCTGPDVQRGCPRLEGEPCMAREAADVAIIDIGHAEDPSATDLGRVCVKATGPSPAVFFDEPRSVMEVGEFRATLPGPLDDRTLVAVVEGLRKG
jgi:hypothetical protein